MSTMDPALACQAFFGLITSVGIVGLLIPPLRKNMIDYGSRVTPKSSPTSQGPKGGIEALLETIGSFQVPHSWFIHYYVASVACSIFWAWQILTHGLVVQSFTSWSKQGAGEGMTVNQVFLAWLFMAVQGTRRLYEDVTLGKPSQSKMWIGVWALGIAYYFVMGITIWVEGIPALSVPASPVRFIEFSKPSLKTVIAVPIFIVGTGFQHDCHVHLASLKKYTLPHHPFFQKIICPHYTCECLIYIALAIVAAPRGYILNKSIVSGLIFVVANLAGTAESSRKWYVEKFGAEQLKGRWRMVPYVY